MGAPIVVNTVKVTGTVNAGGTTPVIGTVSQNATWNVNAIQSGAWNIGGTVNQGGSWTVTADVGSGTWPVTAIQSGAWNVGGTVNVVNSDTTAAYVQGTTTVTNAASNALYARGTVTSTIPSSAPGYVAGTVTIPASAPAYVSGTVSNGDAVYDGDWYSGQKATLVAGYDNVGYVWALKTDSNGRLLIGGTPTVVERGATIAHGSANISSSAQILTSSISRRTVVVTNLGTDYIWLGASGVATGAGLRLAPGQTAVIDRAPQAAVHGVAQSGTQPVSWFTESD